MSFFMENFKIGFNNSLAPPRLIDIYKRNILDRKKIFFFTEKNRKQTRAHTLRYAHTFSHTRIFCPQVKKNTFMEHYQPALIKGWGSNFILFLKIRFSWVTLSHCHEPTARVTTLLSAAWCPSSRKGSTVLEKASFWTGWMISIWTGGQEEQLALLWNEQNS